MLPSSGPRRRPGQLVSIAAVHVSVVCRKQVLLVCFMPGVAAPVYHVVAVVLICTMLYRVAKCLSVLQHGAAASVRRVFVGVYCSTALLCDAQSHRGAH